MKINKEKRGIINSHFLKSLMWFLGVLIIALTFISFLEDAQKNDKGFFKKNNVGVEDKRDEGENFLEVEN